MDKEKLYETSFQIILHSGNARSSAMEALNSAREHKFEEASKKIEEATTELHKAHKFQTQLIQGEAAAEDGIDIPVLLVHAQDHLMTAMLLKDMAIEIIDVRKEFKK